MQQAEDGSRTSVAVIGSGMAGLVSAYLLTQDKDQRFDVEVFETVCMRRIAGCLGRIHFLHCCEELLEPLTGPYYYFFLFWI